MPSCGIRRIAFEDPAVAVRAAHDPSYQSGITTDGKAKRSHRQSAMQNSVRAKHLQTSRASRLQSSPGSGTDAIEPDKCKCRAISCLPRLRQPETRFRHPECHFETIDLCHDHGVSKRRQTIVAPPRVLTAGAGGLLDQALIKQSLQIVIERSGA